MATLHLIDVPALLDGVQELRDQLGQGEAELAHRDLARAIGRWVEADPEHPVVVLVSDAPLEAPPVAGLIGKRVEAVEGELLRRLAHGKGGRYRVVGRGDAVTQAARAAECPLVEPDALWDRVKANVGDPLAEAAPDDAAEAAEAAEAADAAEAAEAAEAAAKPAAKKKTAKKAKKKTAKAADAKKATKAKKKTPAKKAASKKKVAKKAATKKAAAKKAPAKKTAPKQGSATPTTEQPADDKEADPAAEQAMLDRLVEKALRVQSDPPPPPRRASAPAPKPQPKTTDGDMDTDEVSEWLNYFDEGAS